MEINSLADLSEYDLKILTQNKNPTHGCETVLIKYRTHEMSSYPYE